MKETDKSYNNLLKNLGKGLFLYPCSHWNQTIRLIPALTITKKQIDQGVQIFTEAVSDVQKDF